MDKNKVELLKAKGWKVGSTEEFLDLSEEELAYIELKISLSRLIKQLRVKRQLTQQQTADLISSSQSRVAKIEAGDPSVSVDLQIRSLLALGASREELAEAIMS
jgi:DNA-binding XRE family transcriptional regulator